MRSSLVSVDAMLSDAKGLKCIAIYIGVGMTCTLGGGGGAHSISCEIHVQYNNLFNI